jgi:hypothetical protein
VPPSCISQFRQYLNETGQVGRRKETVEALLGRMEWIVRGSEMQVQEEASANRLEESENGVDLHPL